MAGRPRMPTNVLALKGAFKKNPDRARPNEPVPEKAIGKAPSYLTAEQKKAWADLVKKAPPGVLMCSDEAWVEVAAILLSQLRDGSISSTNLGVLMRCLSGMGFSPSDRSKVAVKPAAKKDDSGWEDI